MARKLKVYGINLRGTHRGIVADTSKKEAGCIMDIAGSYVNEFEESGNPRELELALGEPGTVFIAKNFGRDYFRVEPGVHWNDAILAQGGCVHE